VIKCHLSRLMGERKLKISDVARDTGLHRNTVALLYHETATRVDLPQSRPCAVTSASKSVTCSKSSTMLLRVRDRHDGMPRATPGYWWRAT
jgi:hypothetical protein